MEPEVRYCTTTDGVRIAYTVTGEGPPVLYCVDPLISHVQLEWSHPVGSRIFREFARSNTLIRFDFRGCGLSDRMLPRVMENRFSISRRSSGGRDSISSLCLHSSWQHHRRSLSLRATRSK